MVVSSYGSSTTSSGSVKLKKDMSIDPKGRDVLIIEDLIDTGNTLEWIVSHLKTKGCASVRLACLLDKASRRTAKVHVDYVGFTCPDEFVVGYGMDFAGSRASDSSIHPPHAVEVMSVSSVTIAHGMCLLACCRCCAAVQTSTAASLSSVCSRPTPMALRSPSRRRTTVPKYGPHLADPRPRLLQAHNRRMLHAPNPALSHTPPSAVRLSIALRPSLAPFLPFSRFPSLARSLPCLFCSHLAR